MRSNLALTLIATIAMLSAGCAIHRRPADPPTTKPRRGAYDLPSTYIPPAQGIAAESVRLAESLLGAPYRYGGENRRGFDCSGLTSYVYQRIGLAIPRTAQQQASIGEWIPLDELTAGDLVFFGKGRERLFHVGLVVSAAGQPLEMIHSASSRGVVRTVVVDSPYWLDRLSFGRRIVAR